MTEPIVTLSRALDRAGDVLAAVHADDLDKPTPCGDWSVRDPACHPASGPARFLQMARGEEVDWSTAPQIPDGTRATSFRAGADDLIHHWHGVAPGEAAGAGWQTAEMAVHTRDLSRALGRSEPLDDDVAEAGLAFLQASLTDSNRAPVFAPPVPVADDAAPVRPARGVCRSRSGLTERTNGPNELTARSVRRARGVSASVWSVRPSEQVGTATPEPPQGHEYGDGGRDAEPDEPGDVALAGPLRLAEVVGELLVGRAVEVGDEVDRERAVGHHRGVQRSD
ncbi:maleylpyruvate isomerase family mycothiol-dependent enzyme [Nocardioides sp. B-3]|uniref:maleylpyruvate isomerase family mycothiol-dependent enzyme n=1 Tax=Nocardioides sp. B-3 TaxID=2895565 RepID=UPI0021531E81|nr:maleylpyruvate isomerase family mycothiol-dependent enzyme [Nocardioides sp. B-3]UUZ60874.1 maleylpyruvate isomerase family mycothiol-dependent enzyme [Nocardioides sp. B-3]